MRIRLLGPVELIGQDGQITGLSAAKRRTVLATLALELNKVVSADRLMNVAWDDNPPPTARAALQGHIAQLRKMLGDDVELVTRAPGYQLVADRSLVDVTRFDDLIAQARTVPAADGVKLLRSALALWRGPVLADVPASRLREQAAAWLDEARLTTLHDLGERLLKLGRAGEVVGELRDAVERHPTREPLVELLMRCLFETGRQAEALRLFHHTRTALADELGVDPGGDLQQTYQLVLTGADDTIGHPAAAPAQLPRQNRGLTGRDEQLAGLIAGLRGPDPAIRVLTGPAGVGKTALALHCAHALAADMPDGQLFVDLKGFADGEPMEPAVALTGFLRALGVADARIPACVTERSALYRSLLASRRMLVLLDNAFTAEQVRPLLPGTSSCVVLVTSRHRLDDLIATEGAEPLPVGVLALPDAVTVLGLLAGQDRVAANLPAATELAELCDRLPLALRLVAARLASRPDWTIRDMVAEVSGEQRWPRALTQSVSLSYRRLTPSAARLFRLLDQYGGGDIDQYAAAALSATSADEAWSNLDSLTAVHLLHENGRDRYGRRDLVRLFMAQVAAEEPVEQREAAMVRLIDYYVQTAEHACRLLSDHIWSPQSPVEYPADEIPPMSTTQHAMRWFAAESANLHSVLDAAVEQGYQERTWRLSLCLARFYFRRGDPARQFAVCGIGLSAAEGLGNHEAQALFLMTVGTILIKSGQAENALPYCTAATQLSGTHLHTQGAVLTCLGYCYRALGRLDEADAVLQSAVDIATQSGDIVLETYALIGNANVHLERGRVRDALRLARQATDLYSRHKVSTVHALALHAAGSAMYALGRPHGALMLLYQGHAVANDIGDRHLDAMYHREIGNVLAHLGGEQAARPHWAQADRLYDELQLPAIPALAQALSTRAV
jgi:DNA-binding SARP family transcriptional activator/tetratricopeptide (TPR) repeat protein